MSCTNAVSVVPPLCFTALHLNALTVNQSTFSWLFTLQLFIPASLLCCSHTNGSVVAYCISACRFCVAQHKQCHVVLYLFIFLPLLQLRKCFQSDSVELKQQVTWAVYKLLKGPNRFFIGGTFLAKWDNRLHFGTFLERLQPAPHHSATFLISVSKCSLDTLFKRVARQTCTTYSCLYIEIYLELQYIFCYICQETVCIVYCWIKCILNCQ